MSAKEQMINIKTALAWFLAKEIRRHQKDIEKAWRDLHKLQEQGIKIPDPNTIDPDSWIDA
jgi:hypothetical protein